MQIFGAAHQATTLQLRVYDGDLKLNVIHYVVARKVKKFIDGEQKFVKDDGRASFHFTYGVYAAPSDSSHYMESRWNGIKLFKK
ncbi:unnamed protein product [Prunus armeniaca]